ncbi:MAG: PD-(D/E)XK nuclease family protein, partial [Myxococcota bacterium]
MLTGLEDGGYPRAPKLPRRAVLEALASEGLAPVDLVGPGDTCPEALERSTALEAFRKASATLAHALAAARETILMTFCAVDDAGRETYPGAFLMGIRAVAALAEGAGSELETIDRARLMPQALADAVGPAEARACARPDMQDLAPALRAAPSDLSLIADQACGDVHRAGAAGQPVLGPYSGVIDGAQVWDGAASATKLERYGACGYRFWLRDQLGLESRQQAADDPSPLELGRAVHDVLHGVLGASVPRQLFVPHAEREGLAEAFVRSGRREMEQAFAGLASACPSLSPLLIHAYRERWSRVLDRYLDGLVTTDVWRRLDPSRPEAWSDDDLAQVSSCTPATERKQLDKMRQDLQTLARCRASHDSFVPDAPSSKNAVKKSDAWKRAEQAGLLAVMTKGKAAELMSGPHPADALSAGIEAKESELRAKLAKLVAGRRKKWFRRQELITVLRCEYGFGLPESEHEAPVQLRVPGAPALLLRGRIDRLDEVCDGADSCWAVADYKTGRAMSSKQLRTNVVAGTHLQLPLYAAAAEGLSSELAAGGRVLPVRYARLAYPRTGQSADIDLNDSLEVFEACHDTIVQMSVRDVARRHLGAYVGGLRRGEHPLLPREGVCPIVDPFAGGCDHNRICRFDPAIRGHVTASMVPSHLALSSPQADKEAEGSTTRIVQYHPPIAVPASSLTVPEAQAVQSNTEALVGCLDRDVVVTAGAGSGKTHQLVRRVIRAYAEASPLQVACITFTRKAAAEMRYRIRRALIEPDAVSHDAELRSWVERAVARHGGLYATVALVSAAPITTIDGLCLRYAERLTARLPELGAVAVEDGADAAELEEAFQSQLLQHMDERDPRIGLLLETLPPVAMRATLMRFVQDWRDRFIERELGDDVGLPPITPQATLGVWAKGLTQWARQQCRDRLRSTARTLVRESCSMEVLNGCAEPDGAWGSQRGAWEAYFEEVEALGEELDQAASP